MADDASGSAPPIVTPAALQGILSRGRIVISPYPFAVGGADNIRVISFNVVAGVTIEIHGRVAGVDIGGTPFKFSHVPNTNGTKLSQDFVLGAGVVTNLAVFCTSGTPLPSQCFVIVQLLRQIGAGAFVMGTLLQGPVTSNQSLGWPGSPIVTSTEGEPYPRTIVGTAPGGGADVLETVPSGRRWELLSAQATLTLAAGGAAGTLDLRLDDGANVYARVFTGNTGGPSTVSPTCWSQFVPLQNVAISGGVFNLAPLTANRMLAGHRFTFISGNSAANKTWSAPIYNVREWLEVQ